MVTEAVGAPDVVYFKIMGGVTQPYQALDDQPVDVAAIITLVWRPERNQWLVHGMGQYIPPDQVPRTAI
jgi:hypothetical protein